MVEARRGGRRKRLREKPVALKPKAEGTRRSAREKPPVCYNEKVVDMGVNKRRDAAVKVNTRCFDDRCIAWFVYNLGLIQLCSD